MVLLRALPGCAGPRHHHGREEQSMETSQMLVMCSNKHSQPVAEGACNPTPAFLVCGPFPLLLPPFKASGFPPSSSSPPTHPPSCWPAVCV